MGEFRELTRIARITRIKKEHPTTVKRIMEGK
jgi:hypothetical protein